MSFKTEKLKFWSRMARRKAIEFFDPILLFIMPIHLDYSTFRYTSNFRLLFFLISGGYLAISMYAFPFPVSSWTKVFQGYFICLVGYVFFAMIGKYNVFNPIDIPLLIYSLAFFVFKYKLFHMVFRNHKDYVYYRDLYSFLGYIGRDAWMPPFQITERSPIKEFYLSWVRHGILNLIGLWLFSLPSGWLNKVPSYVRIIDLSENFLATLGIRPEDVSKFMGRLPEDSFVVVNFIGNPLKEKVPSPDFLHPRLLVLSEPHHGQMAFHLIEKWFQVALTDEEREVCEQGSWEVWAERFVDLETEVRLVFAWKKCLDVLSLPWDQKIKELPFAAIMLNLAYSLLDDNQNVQIEVPDGGEPAAKLENA